MRCGAGAGVLVLSLPVPEKDLSEAVSVSGVVLALSFCVSGFCGDGPHFLGPHSDGTSDETNLLSSWGTNGPRVRWSIKIGSGYSAPSVVGERLVLHHRLGDEEVVECLQAGTGTSMWRYTYPSHFIDPFGYNNGPRSTPLLTSNRCYTLGAEGKLLCLDLETGKLIWQRDTDLDWAIPPAFFGVGSSPILENNLLIVMVGGQPD